MLLVTGTSAPYGASGAVQGSSSLHYYNHNFARQNKQNSRKTKETQTWDISKIKQKQQKLQKK